MNVLSGKIPENKCISSGKFLYFYYKRKNRDGDFLNQVKHRDIHLAIFLTKKKDVPRFFTLLYHKNNLLSNKIKNNTLV